MFQILRGDSDLNSPRHLTVEAEIGADPSRIKITECLCGLIRSHNWVYFGNFVFYPFRTEWILPSTVKRTPTSGALTFYIDSNKLGMTSYKAGKGSISKIAQSPYASI